MKKSREFKAWFVKTIKSNTWEYYAKHKFELSKKLRWMKFDKQNNSEVCNDNTHDENERD